MSLTTERPAGANPAFDWANRAAEVAGVCPIDAAAAPGHVGAIP